MPKWSWGGGGVGCWGGGGVPPDTNYYFFFWHPQILTVEHPLEESRDCLAFATEPVLASLANVIGNSDMDRPDIRL